MARQAERLEASEEAVRLPALHGHQTLEEMVYAALRRSIGAGELRPGQRLSVSDAARQLGVSRLPVIHALRRLASDGFVVIHPHRSVTVADPTPGELRGLYLILTELDALAAREALGRLDDAARAELRQAAEDFRAAIIAGDAEADAEADRRFHAGLWRRAGIRQLTDLLENLWDQGAYHRALLSRGRQYVEARLAEHDRILRAIEASNVDDLLEALRTHRLNGLERVVGLLAQRR
jgi:DNA-binding GntR family transcriptional regulator